MSDKFKISFHSIPSTGTLYRNNIAVKTMKIKKPKETIDSVISNADGTIFEQIKLKRMITSILNTFDIKSITIIAKDKDKNGEDK